MRILSSVSFFSHVLSDAESYFTIKLFPFYNIYLLECIDRNKLIAWKYEEPEDAFLIVNMTKF